MHAISKDCSVNQVVSKLERVAMRSAVIGLFVSVAIATLYAAMPGATTGSSGIRSSLDMVCVLLWPSSILMLGAQTSHGRIVLFLLSAALNAGYFVLATMLLVTIIHRFNFAASTSKSSAVTTQLYGESAARKSAPAMTTRVKPSPSHL